MEVHDFADPKLGEFIKAIPYGIYDTTNNEGWVSVGDSADTAEFAVHSIRTWWNEWGVTLLVDGRYQEGMTGRYVYESQEVHR